jgi:colicin import membrane protein
MMTIYRLTPEQGAPILCQATRIAKATARGRQQFPSGLRSVEPVSPPELAALAAAGVPLPVAARQRLEVYKAVQRERARGAARAEAIRDSIHEKAREAARAKREEEAARKAALKAEARAEREAAKRKKAAAERKAQRVAAKQAAQEAPAMAATVALAVDVNAARLPWE